MNKFKITLSTIENQLCHEDWEVRSKGLRAVTPLCNDFNNIAEFPQHTKKLEGLLLHSLSDLRSTIIKDCCVAIISVFAAFGNQYADFGENIMPKLVALAYNTTVAMSEPADECGRAIVVNTKLSILKFFVNTLVKDKHNLARQRCVEYTMVLLQNLPTERLQNYVEDFERIIVAGVQDASAPTRVFSRSLYLEFLKLWPERRPHLSSKLDTKILTLIEKESQDGTLLASPLVSKKSILTYPTTAEKVNHNSSSDLPQRVQIPLTKPSPLRSPLAAVKSQDPMLNMKTYQHPRPNYLNIRKEALKQEDRNEKENPRGALRVAITTNPLGSQNPLSTNTKGTVTSASRMGQRPLKVVQTKPLGMPQTIKKQRT